MLATSALDLHAPLVALPQHVDLEYNHSYCSSLSQVVALEFAGVSTQLTLRDSTGFIWKGRRCSHRVQERGGLAMQGSWMSDRQKRMPR